MSEQSVVLVASQHEQWHRRYIELRIRLGRALPHATIEHIGSTAVPDLPAKDVVDVLVGVESRQIEDAVATLADDGFDVEGQRGGHGWLSWPDREARVAVIHVVTLNGTQWRDRLAFRELLRSDIHARARYLDVKRLAAEHAEGWGDYTASKAAVVAELLSSARLDSTTAGGAGSPH